VDVLEIAMIRHVAVCALLAVGLPVILPSAAVAQKPVAGRGVLQAVGLFEQSCVRFAGAPIKLRAWISAHRLPEAFGQQAVAMLGPRAGRAFGASTADGKMALLSLDSGACEVVVEFGDKPGIDRQLAEEFSRLGAVISNRFQRDSEVRGVSQTEMDVRMGQRVWTISTTSKPHTDMPSAPPEVDLLATAKN
jgi:hypothetical protein